MILNKYSLIIPHYNIPHLLRRLLFTVPKREDLQVIVVDDCSTKGIEELEKLMIEYDWIEWYSTGKNGGGGKARNIGLNHAKGEYIFFADSDDFFLPNLNDLLDECKNSSGFDIIFFNVISLDSVTLLPNFRGRHLNEFLKLGNKDLEKATLSLRYLFGEPWCKIIKSEIIKKHNIEFDEVSIHNDTFFSYMVGHKSNKIILKDIAYYCITTRENSVSLKKNEESIIIRANIFSKKHKFLKENNIPLTDNLLFMPYVQSKDDYNLRNKVMDIYQKNGVSEKEIKKLLTKYNKERMKNRFLILHSKIHRFFLL